MTKPANGRFQKGRSGNPGGRPRIPDEVKELARQHGPGAFQRIVAISKGDDARLALAANIEILNRAYGRPGLAEGDLDPDFPVITKIERVIITPDGKREEIPDRRRGNGDWRN